MTDVNDEKTAAAFAQSWNNLPAGSIYSREQFFDWLAPLTKHDIQGKNVLELGCGNAALMIHLTGWQPKYLEGVDLGDSVLTGRTNMETGMYKNWQIKQADLVSYQSNGFDLVCSIGVLHHLKEPKRGLDSVIRNTKPGGRFHCWVYAVEGNAFIIYLVDPLRKKVNHLPWWIIKYLIATPLATPFYIYAKVISWFPKGNVISKLPLYDYSQWIANREFKFFRHVAFDQLVTPRTTYLKKEIIEEWLKSYPEIEKDSTYLIFRNGNSWKFGGQLKNNN